MGQVEERSRMDQSGLHEEDIVMRDDQDIKISMFAHESIVARMERIVRRTYIALIICIVLLFACNLMWLYAWMQYDYESSTEEVNYVTLDSRNGSANYVGNDGDIVNGSDSR